ncbi:MAG TPA: pyridoxal phosphate-dependent aminotransferase [Bacillales bacterium]|nr:pyridoxal phosphate-dependent aminotransferase [Bacillales bacterium]
MKSFEPSKALNRLPEQFFAKLTKKAALLTAEGYDVINLGQGNPDLPTPDHIVTAMQQATANPAYHRYSPFQGHAFLKEAAADYYRREFGVDVDPKNEVAILVGAKTGLVQISQCLLNEGDTALVPDPGYPDYWSGIALANARMETMPLRKENNFLPDYKKMPEELLNKAKLMFLNYPSNPTAVTAPPSFFEKTVELADRHNICVVHDFAYGTIGFDGHKPVSFLQTPGAKDIGIEIYTLSKTYNMAGWRVGFAIGNPSLIQYLELIQDHYFVSLFGAVQEAAAAALNGSQKCVEELVQTYESRRNILINGLREIGWDIEAPEGTFYAWLPVPEGYTSESFADLILEKAHVVVAPGIGFGTEGEGYVRVGLVDSEERLLDAVDRMKKIAVFA